MVSITNLLANRQSTCSAASGRGFFCVNGVYWLHLLNYWLVTTVLKLKFWRFSGVLELLNWIFLIVVNAHLRCMINVFQWNLCFFIVIVKNLWLLKLNLSLVSLYCDFDWRGLLGVKDACFLLALYENSYSLAHVYFLGWLTEITCISIS